MTPKEIPTRFLPAKRSTKAEIKNRSKQLINTPLLQQILDGIPVVVLMLDKNRQIVLANKAVLPISKSANVDSIFGMRPGELLQCIHAAEMEGGCGTTDFCTVCGAANAILSSQKGTPDIKECRINQVDGDALDLRVWTSQFIVGDEKYTFFSVLDVTGEKRRRWLERIFFHDIMNCMSGVYAAAEIMKEASPEEKNTLGDIILSASERAIEEINAQKDLTAAEVGELTVKFAPIEAIGILRGLVKLYENHDVARGKKLAIAPKSENVTFTSDRRLVVRVLENMLKNALEASDAGDTVTLKSERAGDRMRLSVHNTGVIPEAARLQIFQRSFSTKGNDRGLGTYSMKLISERYLKGKVSFTTSERKGTTFVAEYPINSE